MDKRVAVTGLGVITPIGTGKDKFWGNAVNGSCGITRVTEFDTSEYQSGFGGRVIDFNSQTYISRLPYNQLGRASQFSVAAAAMALSDAGISLSSDVLENTAVIMGTTLGEGPELEVLVGKKLAGAPFEERRDNYLKFPVHNISRSICLEFGFQGDCLAVPNACAAGNFALGYAYDLIKSGRRGFALAGGTDPLSEQAFRGFSRLRSMSDYICRPFDKNRKGMMIGEGAGVLFLEELTAAIERGAHIYAEIIGFGSSCDAYHMAMPDPSASGICAAMENAISKAGITAADIDYVCAHGTGTPANDKAESLAVRRIFGGRSVPVTSLKSMTAHTMGAASAIEAILCCLSITHSVITPTINYSVPDPDCDIDCVPNSAREADITIAANNAYAFGGNNSCILFKKVN